MNDDERAHPIRRDHTDDGKLDNVSVNPEMPGLDDTAAAVDRDAEPNVTDD